MNFIALKMLTGDRAKYLGLIFAIAFCTFLLENQTSIFAGILRRTGSQILDVTDADIWVMDSQTEYFEQTKALKDTDQWAVKLFKGNPVARTADGKFAVSFCLGLDDATLVGAPRKMLLGSWERLREPDAIVIDKAGYLLLFPGEPLQIDRTLEMNDHKAVIVGISDASAPFLSYPIIHARYSQAVNFVGRERTQLSYVLARSSPGVSAEEVTRRIEAQTGLRARTTDEFRWDCIGYYLRNTGIPVNFGITITIALIVGTVNLLSVHSRKLETIRGPQGHWSHELAPDAHGLATGPDRGSDWFQRRHGNGSHFLRDNAPPDRHTRTGADVAERSSHWWLHPAGDHRRKPAEYPSCCGT